MLAPRLLLPLVLPALAAPVGAQALGEVLSAVTYSEGSGGFAGVLADGDRFGSSVTLVGDVDGDGVEDVAVGAPGADGAGVDRGALFVLLLRPDGTARSTLRIDDATPALAGLLPDHSAFGTDAAALGDLDGNGAPELAVGAPALADASTPGRVLVLFLDAAGGVQSVVPIGDGLGGFPVSLSGTDTFGLSVGALGDLDGNGAGDFAAGRTAAGTFFTVRLNTDGSVRGVWEIGDGLGGFPADSSILLGSGLALVGDLDGDGLQELAVGESDDVEPAFPPLATSTWIASLNTNGTIAAAVQTRSSDSVFGYGLPLTAGLGADATGLGDIDADGRPDVVFGSPWLKDGDPPSGTGDERGGVWIGLTMDDGTYRKTVRITDQRGLLPFALADGDRFGFAVEAAGDRDADDVPDLFVGAPGTDGLGVDRGAAHLLTLRGNEFPATAVQRFGSGVNDPCFSSVTIPSIGLVWTTSVDGTSFHSDVVIVGRGIWQLPLDPGVLAGTEEVLVDPASGVVAGFYGTGSGSTGGNGIPDIPALLGRSFSAQAFLIRSTGKIELCNAIDLVIGN